MAPKISYKYISKSFELFLYIKIDKKYEKHAFFIESLIYIFVNSSEVIINNLNAINLYDIFFLYNSITKSLLLLNQIIL